MVRPLLVVFWAVASIAPSSAETLNQSAFACTDWAGWHDHTLASLTPKGGRIDKHCPIRIASEGEGDPKRGR